MERTKARWKGAAMKVRELVGRLSGFDPEAEIQLQLGSRHFANLLHADP